MLRSTLLSLGILALALSAGSAYAQSSPSGSGTGFLVNADGWAVTNAHVLDGCTRASVPKLGDATDWIIDRQNDLAAVKVTGVAGKAFLRLRAVPPRLGDDIAAFGYPLSTVLSDSVKVTTGNINSLVGIDNDTRYLQVSTPLQPGNSGGPVVDRDGAVLGVATAVLGSSFAERTGILPQNVNFAVRSNVLELFLQSRGIEYETSQAPAEPLSTADLADMVAPAVVQILCFGQQRLAETEPKSRPNPIPEYDSSRRAYTNRDAAIGFVKSLVAQHADRSQDARSLVLNAYAGNVAYFGKSLPVSEIIADKQRYFERWPERLYRIRDESVSVVCQTQVLCTVSGFYDWSVRSVPRNRQASGIARFSFMVKVDARPLVLSENSEVIQRQ